MHSRNADTLKERVKELKLDTTKMNKNLEDLRKNPPRRSVEEVFCENSKSKNDRVYKELIKTLKREEKCEICGCGTEWNGRPLRLQVHHINGNPHDNRPENLQILCPNCHSQTETFTGKNIKNAKSSSKQNYCIDCGKPIRKKSTRCANCAKEKASKEWKEKLEAKISRKELKNKIRNQTFASISKEFGNIDLNVIYKWCRYYNLPDKKYKIEQYTDEEWELL